MPAYFSLLIIHTEDRLSVFFFIRSSLKGWKVLKRLHSSFEIICNWCNYSALWKTWHQTGRYDFREIECNIHYSTAGLQRQIKTKNAKMASILHRSDLCTALFPLAFEVNYIADFPIGFIFIWSNYHTFTLICPVPCLDYTMQQLFSCWSFEEKTFVKQSMISEWEKVAQKVRFTHYAMLCSHYATLRFAFTTLRFALTTLRFALTMLLFALTMLYPKA